jgi:hypothetical protein
MSLFDLENLTGYNPPVDDYFDGAFQNTYTAAILYGMQASSEGLRGFNLSDSTSTALPYSVRLKQQIKALTPPSQPSASQNSQPFLGGSSTQSPGNLHFPTINPGGLGASTDAEIQQTLNPNPPANQVRPDAPPLALSEAEAGKKHVRDLMEYENLVRAKKNNPIEKLHQVRLERVRKAILASRAAEQRIQDQAAAARDQGQAAAAAEEEDDDDLDLTQAPQQSSTPANTPKKAPLASNQSEASADDSIFEADNPQVSQRDEHVLRDQLGKGASVEQASQATRQFHPLTRTAAQLVQGLPEESPKRAAVRSAFEAIVNKVRKSNYHTPTDLDLLRDPSSQNYYSVEAGAFTNKLRSLSTPEQSQLLEDLRNKAQINNDEIAEYLNLSSSGNPSKALLERRTRLQQEDAELSSRIEQVIGALQNEQAHEPARYVNHRIITEQKEEFRKPKTVHDYSQMLHSPPGIQAAQEVILEKAYSRIPPQRKFTEGTRDEFKHKILVGDQSKTEGDQAVESYDALQAYIRRDPSIKADKEINARLSRLGDPKLHVNDPIQHITARTRFPYQGALADNYRDYLTGLLDKNGGPAREAAARDLVDHILARGVTDLPEGVDFDLHEARLRKPSARTHQDAVTKTLDHIARIGQNLRSYDPNVLELSAHPQKRRQIYIQQGLRHLYDSLSYITLNQSGDASHVQLFKAGYPLSKPQKDQYAIYLRSK